MIPPDLFPIFIPFATSAISLTVTKSKIFSPLREWAKDESEFLDDLLSCPWCFSHWVSVGIIGLVGLSLPLQWFIISIFANVSMAGMLTNFMLRLATWGDDENDDD